MSTSNHDRAMLERSYAQIPIRRVDLVNMIDEVDRLAVEEPLEIRVSHVVAGRRKHQAISITMRTPGHDAELAAGFLLTEGLIRDRADILRIHNCRHGNVVRVHLQDNVSLDLARLERHFYASSSCGVCGKTSMDAVRVNIECRPKHDIPLITTEHVQELPSKLRTAQAIFEHTGGLHASALFTCQGDLICAREDVGRHNALDKLIGNQLLSGLSGLNQMVLVVSGRVSFELVQKAAVAGIPILVAVGAPSSLAIELAKACEMTVLGFVRQSRFNIYCGAQRVCPSAIV